MWPNKVFGKRNILIQKNFGTKNSLVQKIGSQKSRENWVSNSLDYANREKFH